MKALIETLQDTDGSFSFVRVAGFLIIAGIVAEHLIVLLKTGQRVPWDWQQLSAIAAALAAKVAQKPFEKAEPPAPEPVK